MVNLCPFLLLHWYPPFPFLDCVEASPYSLPNSLTWGPAGRVQRRGAAKTASLLFKIKKVQAPFLAGTVSPQPTTSQELKVPPATTPGERSLLVFTAESRMGNPWLDS